MDDKLTQDNFILFTMKAYENPNCLGFSEFKEDLNRIKYIKRLLLKYKNNKILKEILILNHIIIHQNVFGPRNCSRILFFKIPKDLHSYLKSFLDYLNYTPSDIPEININSIETDKKIIEILNSIK